MGDGGQDGRKVDAAWLDEEIVYQLLRKTIQEQADEIRSLKELGEKMAHIIASNCSDAPGAPVALTSWWLQLSDEERLQTDE